MKILADKVNAYPPHALTRQDVKVILAALPDGWKQDFNVVRLSSAIPYNSNSFQFACVDRHSHKFTLATRGLEKQDALTEALSALALHHAQQQQGSMHSTAAMEKQAAKLIAPIFQKLLPQLSREKVWLDHPSRRHKC